MSKIGNKERELPAKKAVEVNTPGEGPRRRKKVEGPAHTKEDPAFAVAVTKKDPKEVSGKEDFKAPSTYSPKALREKARAMLNSGKLNAKETAALQEILGDDNND